MSDLIEDSKEWEKRDKTENIYKNIYVYLG